MLWLEKNKKWCTKVGTSKFISRFILSLWPPGPENGLNKHNTHQIDLEMRSEQGQLSKVTSQGCNPDQGLGERHMAFQSGNYKVRYLVSSTYCLWVHNILHYYTIWTIWSDSGKCQNYKVTLKQNTILYVTIELTERWGAKSPGWHKCRQRGWDPYWHKNILKFKIRVIFLHPTISVCLFLWLGELSINYLSY